MFRRGTGPRESAKAEVLSKHPTAVCRRMIGPNGFRGYCVWIGEKAIASAGRAEDAWSQAARRLS